MNKHLAADKKSPAGYAAGRMVWNHSLGMAAFSTAPLS